MSRTPWIWLVSWWDRLVASDPGRIRLHLAVRTTATVALAFVVLRGLSLAAGLPGTMIMLGLVESLFGSIGVRDPDARQQRVTLLLTLLPAAAAFTLGTALAPFKVWGDIVFLVVIFGAVYTRRFGPRATALGFLAFIPYFMGSYLHLPLAQIPGQILSLVVGAACTYIVRFHILPDHPDETLVRILGDFDRRIGRLLAVLETAIAAGGWHQPHRRRLRRQIVRLNDTALMAEDQLDQLDDDRLLSNAGKRRLRFRLFDLELAAERVADAAFRDLPPADTREAVRQRIGALRQRLHERLPSTLRSPEAGTRPTGKSTANADGRLDRALTAMDVVLDGSPEGARGPGEDTPSPQEERGRTPDGQESEGLRPTTRQAIQVTVACALAIIAGEFLSPDRWYWAVLTAFIVFSGTQSRGDTLIKASQRIIGTVAGVAAGIGVAAAVAHDARLSLLLIFICIFFAYYLFQVAYGAMIFWISIIVALLYGMIGILSTALLVLRIEETAIGAVIGVAVAILLLPVSASHNTRAAASEFLHRLSDAVERAARRMAGDRSAFDAAGVSRDLDRAFQTLRTAARPLASGLAGAVARTEIRQWLHLLRACAYYARNLARLSEQENAGADPELTRALTETASRIRRDTDAVAGLIACQKSPIAIPGNILERIEEAVAARYEHDARRCAAPERQAAALYAIDHIDEAIQFLKRRLGPREIRLGEAGPD